MEPENDVKGITRFHKLTIGIGMVFCLLLAWRFFAIYLDNGASRAAVYSGAALAGAVLLAIYLRSFSKRGI